MLNIYIKIVLIIFLRLTALSRMRVYIWKSYTFLAIKTNNSILIWKLVLKNHWFFVIWKFFRAHMVLEIHHSMWFDLVCSFFWKFFSFYRWGRGIIYSGIRRSLFTTINNRLNIIRYIRICINTLIQIWNRIKRFLLEI